MKSWIKSFFMSVVPVSFLIISLLTGCTFQQSTFQEKEGRYTYHEFDGVNVFYKTNNLTAYRELLPAFFDLPDEPLVWAFVSDYYKMDNATQPYLEAAIFLLAKYNGEKVWHCINMPVTSDEARLGGIYYLGFPKIMGEVTLKRSPSTIIGTLMLKGRTVMTITHDIRDGSITKSEEEWFRKLAAIRSLNILNGKIFEPKFGNRANLLERSRTYPDKFIVKVGTAKLMFDSEAAGLSSRQLADVYSLQPSEIVLAYYLKNKFVLRFQN
jgi:acetoacetate decarboxylase